jgi:hypothetical protein
MGGFEANKPPRPTRPGSPCGAGSRCAPVSKGLDAPPNRDAVERIAGELRRYEEIGYKELQFAVLGFGDERTKPGWTASEVRAGQRVISKEEAERKIKAKSPFGWKRIGWDREMERR